VERELPTEAMKVLHLTDDLEGLGGIQSYLHRLGEGLAPLGVECVLYAPPGGIRPWRGHLSRWYSPSLARRARELARAEACDLVHAHSVAMRLSPAPLGVLRTAGLPVVMTVHDYGVVCPRRWMIDHHDRPCEVGFGARCLARNCRSSRDGWLWHPYHAARWLKTALHRRLLRREVDVFISPSEDLAGWVRSSLAVTNVECIPNFGPEPEPAPPPPGAGEGLLFAGRLTSEKGVDVLLRAMAELLRSFPHGNLTIAGEGPERPALEVLADRLGVGSSVRFAGRLEGEALDASYRESVATVLPTLWMENCPVAVLESFGHGRPVVGTRVGGVPELVEEGVTGLLFERGDVAGLASRLGELLADRARLEAMGRHAWRAATTRYSRRRHAERLLDLYRRLVE
jgi:glycosyltransferase involved in cell wall biosynthesis